MEKQIVPINKPVIYYFERVSEYSGRSIFKNALKGFRILNVNINEKSTMIESPVESGIRVVDNKVIMPVKIRVTGICDNVRGNIKLDEEHDKITQDIITSAKEVYSDIYAMLREKDFEETETGTRPVTYTIATKGLIYRNMILTEVSQVNDAEHLLVIPVTLTFTELMFIGDDLDPIPTFLPDDSGMKSNGSLKVDGTYVEYI